MYRINREYCDTLPILITSLLRLVLQGNSQTPRDGDGAGGFASEHSVSDNLHDGLL